MLQEHLPSIQMKGYDSSIATQNNGQTSGSAGSSGKSSNSSKDSNTCVFADFEIRPLYAALPPDEQLLAFRESSPNIRKFILATNIAETSVTISGIKYGNFCL